MTHKKTYKNSPNGVDYFCCPLFSILKKSIYDCNRNRSEDGMWYYSQQKGIIGYITTQTRILTDPDTGHVYVIDSPPTGLCSFNSNSITFFSGSFHPSDIEHTTRLSSFSLNRPCSPCDPLAASEISRKASKTTWEGKYQGLVNSSYLRKPRCRRPSSKPNECSTFTFTFSGSWRLLIYVSFNDNYNLHTIMVSISLCKLEK